MLYSKLVSAPPEFSVYFDRADMALNGRLYVPHLWAESSPFLAWVKSVRITHKKSYSNGAVLVWFRASLDEYYRLAVKYPHSKSCLRAKTHNLINASSTLLNDR